MKKDTDINESLSNIDTADLETLRRHLDRRADEYPKRTDWDAKRRELFHAIDLIDWELDERIKRTFDITI